MQTFLPYPSYPSSARALDNKRLGKQRVEALQILTTLLEDRQAWNHHPAVLMWRGYEGALLMYLRAVCDEWRARGYVDTCWEKGKDLWNRTGHTDSIGEWPAWHGLEELHRSHRLALYTKNPDYYRTMGREASYLPEGWAPGMPTKDIYLWPVRWRSGAMQEHPLYTAYKQKEQAEA